MPISDLKEPQRGPIGHALFLLPRPHGLGAHVQGLGEHRLRERETCAKARDTSPRERGAGFTFARGAVSRT